MPNASLTSQERLPPRTSAERKTPDKRVRCGFCDAGIMPGEVFGRPRECCEEGRRFDSELLRVMTDAPLTSNPGALRDLVDPECVTLAEHFLADETGAVCADDVQDLAEEIQAAVEGWFAEREERDERSHP